MGSLLIKAVKLPPLFIAAATIGIIMLSACGVVSLGGGTNDPTPNGTLLAQGSFASNVTGTAAVYSTGGDGYTTYLSGINIPSSDTNLELVTYIGGTAVNTQPIEPSRYTLATAYSFSTGVTGTFTQVQIISTNSADDIISTASLF